MVSIRSVVELSTLLCTAPFLYGSLMAGEDSCVISGSFQTEISYATDAESIPIRGYGMTDTGDLLYSVDVIDKLWHYFTNKAESFTPEEVAVIDKEFWNLG